jgi:hypothetical protein
MVLERCLAATPVTVAHDPLTANALHVLHVEKDRICISHSTLMTSVMNPVRSS